MKWRAEVAKSGQTMLNECIRRYSKTTDFIRIIKVWLYSNYTKWPGKNNDTDKTVRMCRLFCGFVFTYALVRISIFFLRKNVIIFLFINFNMYFGRSKEPSHWDGSFEYPQHMFWLTNEKIDFQVHSYLNAYSIWHKNRFLVTLFV